MDDWQKEELRQKNAAELRQNSTKAFIALVADGLKSADETTVRDAARYAIVEAIKGTDMKQVLCDALRPLFADELERFKKTEEFQKLLAASVGNAVRDVMGKLRCEATRY